MKRVYLDHHATTPADPAVVKAMLPYFGAKFGNAASGHAFGREAATAVERARAQVAKAIGADSNEIVFTSGATESNNLAVKGAAEANREKGRHLVTTAIEHKSGIDPCRRLEWAGFEVTVVPPGSDGVVSVDAVRRAIRSDTVIVSVMLANNEIGTLQPVAEIAAAARKAGALMHTDAAQALGKIPVDVRKLGVDLASFSAHKLYGPKGVGALYVRKRGEPQVKLVPLFDGGSHERGIRSGTPNVPGAVGFGAAAVLAAGRQKSEARRLGALRDRLLEKLLRIGGCHVNGSLEPRLPQNLNVSFEGVDASRLMESLPWLAISSGSACLSSSAEPSYVLAAIGVSEELRRGSLRFGLGRSSGAADLDRVASAIARAVKKMRDSR